MALVPKVTHRFNAVPVKSSMAFFKEIIKQQQQQKNCPKICLELQRNLNRQSCPEKEQSWRHYLNNQNMETTESIDG